MACLSFLFRFVALTFEHVRLDCHKTEHIVFDENPHPPEREHTHYYGLTERKESLNV